MSTRRNTPGRSPMVRYTRRALAGLSAVVAAAVLAACSDAPSAPARPAASALPSFAKAGAPGQDKKGNPNRESIGQTLATPVVAPGLLRARPLAAAVTRTYTVTNSGGYFALAEAGLHIFVPQGAVGRDTPLTMTVTAPAGDVVAYEFGPHGTLFNKPLILVQDLHVTNWQRKTAALDVGYFANAADLDVTAKTALVRERMPTYLDVNGSRLYWGVDHFSGYMVSWGFEADRF